MGAQQPRGNSENLCPYLAVALRAVSAVSKLPKTPGEFAFATKAPDLLQIGVGIEAVRRVSPKPDTPTIIASAAHCKWGPSFWHRHREAPASTKTLN
jgi:hypothetical protein